MAVEDKKASGLPMAGRRLLVGTNVLLATLLVVAIVGVLQWGAYRFSGRADLTSSGVNSLSEGTERLLDNLDEKVWITTAYFETDLEGEDQAKFRGAVEDLVELYQIENRSRVEIEALNPLQDHEKRQKLLERLRDKPGFKEQAVGHGEILDRFEAEVLPQVTALLDAERSRIAAFGDTLAAAGGTVLGQIDMLLQNLQGEAGAVRQDIRNACEADLPRYSAATSELRSFYSSLSKACKDIGTVGSQVNAAGNLPAEQAEFLAGAQARYAELVETLDREVATIGELPALDLDDIARQLAPDSNPIIVETETDARVVAFRDIWPPLDPSASTSMAFKDRAFRGEEKVSSAILQLTEEQKTAVVFVRHGGQPLFFGGFMPNQPQPAYAQVKLHLEDLNFVVEEWDLATQPEPPEIDPPPARTIYVVLKPTSPPPNPMMQQDQTPFGEEQRRAILDAIGEDGRAVFLAGWYPGPFGPMPGQYEYADHLAGEWGIQVDWGTLLLRATPFAPGKYRFGRGAAFMTDCSFSDHAISERLKVLPMVLPYTCPLRLQETPPEGVTLERLVWCEQSEGLWGVKDVQAYLDQMRNEYVVRVEGDEVGTFTVAAVAEKGEAKMAVISSRGFCTDEMAFARDLMLTAEGLTLRSRNPGNLTLLVNTLHWLNDNEQIMDLGRPIDSAALEIAEGPTLSFLRVLVWAIWPIAVAVCGAAVWFVRRR